MRLSPAMKLQRWLLFLSFSLLLPATSWANGMRSHLVITEMAIKRLPEGSLKTILTQNKQAVLSGSYFPDSGYAAKDGYGEIAHWEPFLSAFLKRLQSTFKAPFRSEEAGKHVAFLMGVASHSMADQCFDTLFMAKSREIDGNVDELDLAGDIFLVIAKKSSDPPPFWVPWEEASKAFSLAGHKVTESTLQTGMQRARLAQVTLGLLAGNDYERLKKKMPWAHKMLQNDREPGALPYLSQVVANYWMVLWRRLKNEDAMEQALLISQPAPNTTDFEVAHQSVTSQLTFFFGYPLLKSTYTSVNLTLEQVSPPQIVPIAISYWGPKDSANTLKLRPKSDLNFDTEYRVTLKKGLTNQEGKPLPQNLSFTFRTRPQNPRQESVTEANRQESVTEAKVEPSASPEPSNDGGGTGPDANTTTKNPSEAQGCGCHQEVAPWFCIWLYFVLFGWMRLWRKNKSV